MPSSHADLNLLFGIIALQMDFIGRDALIDSLHAWTLDKENPLGDILIESGDLTLQRRELLDQLVNEHLKRHENDPEQSLGSIPSDTSVREALQAIADVELRQALTHTSAAGPSHVEFADHDATQQVPAATNVDQRFRVLRPHARGGLGQVSVAFDQQLCREVALKELQMKFAGSNVTRERFMMEAEVTGGLEHPGIVPVYGLGHYSDGRPYYAMRFIHGDNLKEAIDRFYREQNTNRNLALRNLLRRFIDVCDAIQYAHSRGILHRDLKPGNIMLGKYGETLVVDWGLAKPIDSSDESTALDGPPLRIASGSGSSQTSMGSAVGTPGYMSPEQASGRLDLLGPASDVYGLGATLYHLLTGTAPFGAKISEVLKKVERGEFEPPRAVRHDVPRALEAICLKAMATRPIDRYDSPFQLAEDIEHWLADEAVTAWREPATVRIRRFVRHHSTLVTSVTAAACMGLVVVGVSLGLLQKAYQREQASHARVRHVVDDYFTQVSEATLLNQPGAQTLRRELLERAADHYEQFLRENGDEMKDALQVELGKAHFRLGVIRDSLDSPSSAMSDLDSAATIQRRLVVDSPNTLERRYDLGMTLNARGRLLHKEGRLNVAVKAFAEALEVREHLVTMRPSDVEYVRTLANSHMNLGETFRRQREYERAVAEFGKAHTLRTTALEQSPNNLALLRDSAKGHHNLGNLHFERGQSVEAEKSLSAAVALFEQLRKESPNGLELLELTALGYRRLGDLQQLRQAFEAATASYEHAVVLSQVLYHQNPAVRHYRETYAAILFNRAVMNAEQGSANDAIAGFELARSLFLNLFEEFPNDTPYQAEYAAVVSNLGELLLTLERPVEAMEVMSEAFETIKLPSGEVSDQSNLSLSKLSYNLGRSHWCQGNPLRARQLMEDAHDRLELVLKQEPARQERPNQLAEIAVELYALCLASAQESPDVQREVWQQTLHTLRDELTRAESDTWLSHQTAGQLRAMARLQWTLKRFNAAVRTMELSIAQWQRLADGPDSVDWSDELDETLGDLAVLLMDFAEAQRGNSPTKSRGSLERANALLIELVKSHPEDEFYGKHLHSVEALLQGLGMPN